MVSNSGFLVRSVTVRNEFHSMYVNQYAIVKKGENKSQSNIQVCCWILCTKTKIDQRRSTSVCCE